MPFKSCCSSTCLNWTLVRSLPASGGGSWGASTSFDAHWDHEPHQLANHCRRDPPLPEGEGRGEGKRGVRIPRSCAPPSGSWKGGPFRRQFRRKNLAQLTFAITPP